MTKCTRRIDNNNAECPCLSFQAPPQLKGESGRSLLCIRCGHLRHHHDGKVSTVQTIFEAVSANAKSKAKSHTLYHDRTIEENAREEVNAGFRPKNVKSALFVSKWLLDM